MFVLKNWKASISSVWSLNRRWTGSDELSRWKIDLFFSRIRKEETDDEAMEIRQNCEDYVIKVNDLHSDISTSKSPTRRVSEQRNALVVIQL